MKLLSQHTLNGHGGMGEGMSMQLAKGGRRVRWLAHESAPKHFTADDITDPRKPKVIVQTDLPPKRLPAKFDAGFRAHNTNVYPQRPDRCYLGYLDGGMMIMDISDRARPRMISRWMNSPPFNGFTHTVLPLFGRNLFVVTDEAVQDDGKDWPKLMWLVDARDERNLVSISTLPVTGVTPLLHKGGRCGAHNVHENPPGKGAWRSEDYVLGTFFNAGVRAYDVRDPYQPREVAHFIPDAPERAPAGTAQINDVFVDDRGIVFAVDRHAGGLYCLETVSYTHLTL